MITQEKIILFIISTIIRIIDRTLKKIVHITKLLDFFLRVDFLEYSKMKILMRKYRDTIIFKLVVIKVFESHFLFILTHVV